MERKYGYIRVSKTEQETARQWDLLRKHGILDEFIIEEKWSGATAKDREKLMALLNGQLRKGDYLYVESFSRLGRSLKDLLSIVERLGEIGVIFVSIKENIDMSTPTGELMARVMMCFADFERSNLIQRTNEGLTAAKSRGRVGGRPRVDIKKVKQALSLMDSGGHSVNEIVESSGISRATIYRYKNEKDKSMK